MSRLFGTDGIRDVAGRGKLRPDRVLRLGAALAVLARERRPRPRVLIGRDTRASGTMLESALAAGLLAEGARIDDAGVLPTPAVALLTRRLRYDLGIVLSASHNPWRDNGIKVFGADARKLPSDAERAVEAAARGWKEPSTDAPGERGTLDDAVELYVNETIETLGSDLDLRGVRIVVDAANGAAHRTAPETLARLGAEVIAIHDQPNGRNINVRCGALHPKELSRAVLAHDAAFGVSLDGDADRSIFCDENGAIVDGDPVLLVLARWFKARRRLTGNIVVGTSMTNLALEIALRDEAVGLVRTDVGDRFISHEMLERGWALGGEPSGHVLFRMGRRPLVGDGLATALLLLGVMADRRALLGELVGGYRRAPQVLLNVVVDQKPKFNSINGLQKALEESESKLGTAGRVVIRYSGTEPLARVMVEGLDAGTVAAEAEALTAIIRREIGTDR